MSKRKLAVGIDLGTTYSAISYYDPIKKTPVMLPNSANQVTTPSVVCITNGEILIGQQAKLLQSQGETDAVAFYKCMMGNLDFSVYLDGRAYNAEDLSAIFLEHFVRDVAEANQIEVESAVITVPAYFNHTQRKATMNAGQRAGLNVKKIVNEPTAAILAYGLADSGAEKNVLVYDLGGGTFDITIARLHDRNVDVIATAGNHDLGGKDWDMEFRDHICRAFYEKTGVDIAEDDEEYYAELLVQCEGMKKKLTEVGSSFINLKCGGHRERIDFTRAEFDDVTRDKLMITMDLMEETLAEAGKKLNRSFGYSDIDEVVLVGGSTLMPQVYEYLSQKISAKINRSVDVNCIVSQGASIQAYICACEEQSFALPAKIADVTAHSLGIITINDDHTAYINTKVIAQNATIPAKDSQRLAIRNRGADTFIEVYLTQGETEAPEDCVILGKYVIRGFQKEASDRCEVEMTYMYDENGIVNVFAVQCSSGGELAVEVIEDIGDLSWLSEPPKLPVARGCNVCFVLDSSGSMCSDLGTAADSAEAFMSNLPGEQHRFSVIAFADKVKELCPSTSDLTRVRKALQVYREDGSDAGICTGARPMEHMRLSNWFDAERSNTLVVLTDGAWSRQSSELAAAKELKEQGIRIHAIGIADADEAFLKRLASEDGTALKTDVNDLVDSFAGIAQAVGAGDAGDDTFMIMGK